MGTVIHLLLGTVILTAPKLVRYGSQCPIINAKRPNSQRLSIHRTNFDTVRYCTDTVRYGHGTNTVRYGHGTVRYGTDTVANLDLLLYIMKLNIFLNVDTIVYESGPVGDGICRSQPAVAEAA